MAQDIELMNALYLSVPAILLPKSGGGMAAFTDVSDTTATAGDVAAGTYFYTAGGVRTQGTGSGGITPTGNIDITQAGQTDVTNYATATVPSARTLPALNHQYVTENNERKWKVKASVVVDPEDGGQAGWIAEGTAAENTNTFSAIPANTTVTPSTSAQTIGGANYMMEGAVTVAAMPTGTAGTPTATKGAVSNHSVTVTPSVTNTTGYITGSTKTGTAVTVTAAELESGTKSITANGTNIDVTGYAAVDVAVPTGSSKNVQVVQSTSRTTSTTLAKVSGSITVSKTGTYDIYWSACRTNTSSSYTWGTRMYIGNTAYGTENTTWSNNTQNNHLTNVSLTANDVISVYARGRGGNNYAMVPMLLIIES